MNQWQMWKDIASEESQYRKDVRKAEERNQKTGLWSQLLGMGGSYGLPLLAAALMPGIGVPALAAIAGVGGFGAKKLGEAAAGGYSKGGAVGSGKFLNPQREEASHELDLYKKNAHKSQVLGSLMDVAMTGVGGLGKEYLEFGKESGWLQKLLGRGTDSNDIKNLLRQGVGGGKPVNPFFPIT